MTRSSDSASEKTTAAMARLARRRRGSPPGGSPGEAAAVFALADALRGREDPAPGHMARLVRRFAGAMDEVRRRRAERE